MDLFLLLIGVYTWHFSNAEAQSPSFELLKSPSVKYLCPDLEVSMRNGVIASPFYPNVYPSHLSCTWHIQGNIGDIISIQFEDIDIEESCCCDSHPCCLMNWLKIGPLSNGTEQRFCGKEIRHHHSVTSSGSKLWIKFHISEFSKGGRGFKFTYAMVSNSTTKHCTNQEFKCGNNKCVPSSMRCNGIRECQDGTDEHNCSNRCASGLSCRSHFQCYDAQKHCDGLADCTDLSDEVECGFCASEYVRCSHNSSDCYHPIKERCDGTFNCLNGADEMDCYTICPGKVTCDSRRGCYSMKQRCNGVTQCEDASDEKNCVPELCNYEHGGFLCDNRRCIEQIWTCDHTDDCGDGSDERKCIRNGILTAAIMGSLICGLLIVIAISCTCRLHALRMLETRIMGSRETPFSRLSREFIFREPPPSYAVAVQHDPRHNLYGDNYNRTPMVQIQRNRRRPRRPRHHRSIHRPQVPPNISLEPGRPPESTSIPPPLSDMELLDDVSVLVAGENQVSTRSTRSIGTWVRQEVDLKLESTLMESSSSMEVPIHLQVDKDLDQLVPCSHVQTPDRRSINVESLSMSSQTDEHSSPSVIVGGRFYCDSDTDPLVV